MSPTEIAIIVALYLFTLLWTACFGIIPPLIMGLITLYVSYKVAKKSAEPILEEAIKIRKVVTKAVKAIVPDDVWKKVRSISGGKKGGSYKHDPVSDFLDDKTGGLFSYFKGKGGKKDEGRIKEIVEESARKHGVKRRKKDEPDLTPVK